MTLLEGLRQKLAADFMVFPGGGALPEAQMQQLLSYEQEIPGLTVARRGGLTPEHYNGLLRGHFGYGKGPEPQSAYNPPRNLNRTTPLLSAPRPAKVLTWIAPTNTAYGIATARSKGDMSRAMPNGFNPRSKQHVVVTPIKGNAPSIMPNNNQHYYYERVTPEQYNSQVNAQNAGRGATANTVNSTINRKGRVVGEAGGGGFLSNLRNKFRRPGRAQLGPSTVASPPPTPNVKVPKVKTPAAAGGSSMMPLLLGFMLMNMMNNNRQQQQNQYY